MAESTMSMEGIETVHIPRSYFNRSKKHITSMEAGLIYPVYHSMLIPNDLVKISVKDIVRQLPTKAPSFSEFELTLRAFVVSYRNLDKNFYRFMTGYKEYSLTSKYEEPLKVWSPSSIDKTKIGTLWDALGYPVNCIPDNDSLPLAFPKDMYNYIYDLYFRNQTLEESILIDGEPASSTNEDLLRINIDRDYFSTVLPFQQLSDPIALPVTGSTKATYNGEELNKEIKSLKDNNWYTERGDVGPLYMWNDTYSAYKNNNVFPTWTNNPTGRLGFSDPTGQNTGLGIITNHTHNIYLGNLQNLLNDNIVSMQNISSVLISELRYAFALQLLAEMQARGGIRDNEFLLMQFGTAPTDEALQRPIYIGGFKTSLLTSEVLQTSESSNTSPLGDMGGHGLGVGMSNEFSYHAKEFGHIMILAYIKPKNLYGGQGMKRENTLRTRFDFPLPVLGHLSEQPIFERELVCHSTKRLKKDGTLVNNPNAKEWNATELGFRPVFDWARMDTDTVGGLLRKEIFIKDDGSEEYNYNLYNWTEARFFTENQLTLINKDFLKVKLDNRNYTIIDDTINRSQFLVWFDFDAHYWRPLSLYGTPGRIDHII